MPADTTTYDLVIVGGGINGAGIARDAAGRGLKVLLCERDDLASHTSSNSTKLIHGGLRYLEYYEFSLVRKSLMEREVLMRAAPHIIWPMRFVMPHSEGLRPRWMIRAGLFLYDNLGGRKLLPRSKGIKLARHPAGGPLQDRLTRGYEYSDCWVEDSRLVVLNAMDARARGARIMTRTMCTDARRGRDQWTVELKDTFTSEKTHVTCRALVNAAGPWVSNFLTDVTNTATDDRKVRLIKGSHIVVPQLFTHDYSYIFQNPDGRIVFAIPYEGPYTLIGTTDALFEGDPSTVTISDEEIDYLCTATNSYFTRQITAGDIAWTYSGVRPLYDDAAENASAITRDYVLDLDKARDKAPLLSIFGGKITTYRKLAEEVIELLAKPLGLTQPKWTDTPALPGGDMPNADFHGWLKSAGQTYGFLPEDLLLRYGRRYGTRLKTLVGPAQSLADLGENLGDDVYTAELEYLIRHEWAMVADDVLWRRSKLGMHISDETRQRVVEWFEKRDGAATADVRV